jgi:hypothetical protein
MNDCELGDRSVSRYATHFSQTFDSIEGSRTATNDNDASTAEFTSAERRDGRPGFVCFQRL